MENIENLNSQEQKIPSYIGRYKILKELGRGGMGKVYHAIDPNLDREIALKVMLTDPTDSILVQRFLQEAKATARLNHRHIVQVHDIGQEGKINYFTMDYIEGESLAQLLKKHLLSHQKTTNIMIKIAKAIEEAHKHQIIHRDLKPANIMINHDQQPLVMDFGLAKLVEN